MLLHLPAKMLFAAMGSCINRVGISHFSHDRSGFHVEEDWDSCGLYLIGAVGAARCLCDHGIAAGRAGRRQPEHEGGGLGVGSMMWGRGAGWVCDQEGAVLFGGGFGLRVGVER